MSKGRFFSSPLGPVMASYIALKQALGRRYAVEGAVLESLDHFLSHAGAAGADLNAETFAAWCRRQVHFASGVRRNRMRIVRNLCLYRRRTEPDCFVPDPVLFPAPHQRVQPYIFNESEIARLLAKASTLQRSSNSPLCPQVFRLAIVLLYTTGLRRGELVRLTVGDYDRKEGVLHIRASKFHKSRLLPVPEDVAGEIERYLRARRGLLPRVVVLHIDFAFCGRSR